MFNWLRKPKMPAEPWGIDFVCIRNHVFKESEFIKLDTYNYGGESITNDACPQCKSDMIFLKE